MKWSYAVATLSLFLIGCASNQPKVTNNTNIINPNNLDGAKYISGLIWQDSPNMLTQKVKADKAMQYCQNLNLAYVKGWRLPNLNEVKQMAPYSNKFQYNANKPFYHTNEHMCGYNIKTDPVELLFSPITIALETLDKTQQALQGVSDQSCAYHINKRHQVSTSVYNYAYVRCVLDVDKYNKAQQARNLKIQQLISQDSYDSNIELFKMTKDLDYIKKAFKKAKTRQQKLQAERLLADNMKDKLFDIIINNKKSNLNTQKAGILGVVSAAVLTDKDFVNRVTVKSNFLEYGTYKVKIKFILNLQYHAVMMGIGTSTSKKNVKVVTYTLSPRNNYTDTKTIRFKGVPASMKQSLMGYNAMSITLEGAKLEYQVISVE
jgi:hypothetical protein